MITIKSCRVVGCIGNEHREDIGRQVMATVSVGIRLWQGVGFAQGSSLQAKVKGNSYRFC